MGNLVGAVTTAAAVVQCIGQGTWLAGSANGRPSRVPNAMRVRSTNPRVSRPLQVQPPSGSPRLWIAADVVHGSGSPRWKSVASATQSHAVLRSSVVRATAVPGFQSPISGSGAPFLEDCPGYSAYGFPHVNNCDYNFNHTSQLGQLKVCVQLLDEHGEAKLWEYYPEPKAPRKKKKPVSTTTLIPVLTMGSYWDMMGWKSWIRDLHKNEGDSWCIHTRSLKKLINFVGCENIHVRCEATDMAWVMEETFLDRYRSDVMPPGVRAVIDIFADVRQCLKEQCPFKEKTPEDIEDQPEKPDEVTGEAQRQAIIESIKSRIKKASPPPETLVASSGGVDVWYPNGVGCIASAASGIAVFAILGRAAVVRRCTALGAARIVS